MNLTVVRAAALGVMLLVQLASGASSRGSEGLYSVDYDIPPIVFPDLPDNYALSDIAGRLGVSVDDMKARSLQPCAERICCWVLDV